jgi:hypothetical protein
MDTVFFGAAFTRRADIAPVRAYLRQRERLLDYAASRIQHMQKALMQMNLQLHHVVSGITGKTGMRIIRAILDGTREPAVLAEFRDIRCKASAETIAQALEGNCRPEHLFALSQAVALYDTYQTHVAECDQQLEELLARLHAPEPPESPLPAPRYKMPRQPNGLKFDVRAALYAMIGVDLTQIHGIGPYLALKLVGECGPICRNGRVPSTSPPGCAWRRAIRSPASRCFPPIPAARIIVQRRY